MDKSFQTLSQDPWNKLKVYVCLRLVEAESNPRKRAERFLELADLRRPIDLAFAFDLVELALKTAPTEATVLSRARTMLEAWTLSGDGRGERPGSVPSPVATQMPKGVAGETAAKSAMNNQASAEGLVTVAESVASQSVPVEASGPHYSLAAQKKALREEASKQIRALGITGFFRQIAKTRGIKESALNGLEDFQPTWMGIVQFLELLRFRKGVSATEWADVRDEVEAVLMLIEPKGKALRRMRDLESN